MQAVADQLDLDVLNPAFEKQSAQQIIDWSYRQFGDDLAPCHPARRRRPRRHTRASPGRPHIARLAFPHRGAARARRQRRGPTETLG